MLFFVVQASKTTRKNTNRKKEKLPKKMFLEVGKKAWRLRFSGVFCCDLNCAFSGAIFCALNCVFSGDIFCALNCGFFIAFSIGFIIDHAVEKNMFGSCVFFVKFSAFFCDRVTKNHAKNHEKKHEKNQPKTRSGSCALEPHLQKKSLEVVLF